MAQPSELAPPPWRMSGISEGMARRGRRAPYPLPIKRVSGHSDFAWVLPRAAYVQLPRSMKRIGGADAPCPPRWRYWVKKKTRRKPAGFFWWIFYRRARHYSVFTELLHRPSAWPDAFQAIPTVWQKRCRNAAKCALVAVPVGFRVPASVPLTMPLPTAQLMASLA